MRLLQGQAFWELFRQAESTAFHLETRDAYDVDDENPHLARFLAGRRDDDYAWFQPWLDLMRAATDRGVAVSRVRVVTVPLPDYHRWLLSITQENERAGEDIRYVPRHLAGELPADDWWLLDGSLVAFNLVDVHGAGAGVAVTDDRRIVHYCRSVRERLWDIATPYAEFAHAAL
ncbi:hypothetical protein IU443_21645 [Nocardia farcinica]|uniref:DUF6879 family protein n=1 Tax=Nocardia TaxID=1817 RepID=UPI000BEFEDC3|nr:MULTISPECIES: DUF6879 family protein [Nocardia]MBF6188734.1 hypothetical protein [Nocardia farcinica]MBF6264878.1 hypothetical protein [Nocardia farcinica]MBF6283664.1 hypothetical protein [Nocardia farcinica]MBF6307383.1 hypothetical protein [Nocardia farcinica]MBF6314824.1 hypothetical protein [Nocardia farcinica]